MTREGLRKHWDVVVAFKDGATVECRGLSAKGWEEEREPAFFHFCEYRVKPARVPSTKTEGELLNALRLLSGADFDDMNDAWEMRDEAAAVVAKWERGEL